ncbi:hypothetical protein [Nocardia sp. NPDC020380]|uniref:hypothetical protein n=1 Tax=Nocardia sp. NPDC020380 TaxID=3364309 RepID=UPI0037AE1DA7
MKFKKFAVTSALAIAALGITAGTANADPAAAGPGIHWNTKLEGQSVVLNTDLGSLDAANGQFEVRDTQGALVTSFPLSFVTTGDGLAHPVDAQIDGNTATLTPDMNPADASPAPVLHDVANQADQDAAFSAAVNELGLASSIGTLIGTLVGGVAGCVIGAAGGAVLGVAVLSVPTGIAGCVAGAAIGIPLGAAAGLIIAGVPTLVVVGIQLAQRLSAPDSTPAAS